MKLKHRKIMSPKFQFFVLSVHFLSLIFSVRSTFISGNTDFWCNQTPYPGPCMYHMPKSCKIMSSIIRADFRTMAVQVALNKATIAANSSKQLCPKCQNERETAAWTSCMKFYDLTLLKLNQILDPNRKPSNLDIQTWTSAALTNLHTCETCFEEQNVTNNIFHYMFNNNVTKLITNILAINKVFVRVKSDPSEFPSWLSKSDQLLLQSKTPFSPAKLANVMVDQDGSGNFQTVSDALKASLSRTSSDRYVIYVKKGVYKEYPEVSIDMKNIMLVGDGLRLTIITGDKSHPRTIREYTKIETATFKVMGDGFIARDISFENTAGPENGQAVALLSSSDHSAFYLCSTLYVHSQRQFFYACDISGTIDFIFGNAVVVFQNCFIYARKPIIGCPIVITAQGRETPDDITGISLQNASVFAAAELIPVLDQHKVYLGRPWRPYARVVFMQSWLDPLVDRSGWLVWESDDNSETVYYAEYQNRGPGSSTRGRVKWPGCYAIQDANEATQFCVGNFIDGQTWLPETGVPFYDGLINDYSYPLIGFSVSSAS